MTTPTRTLCAPWASLPDLPTDRPKLPNRQATNERSDALYEDLCWQASEILHAMTARQFTGACESTVELRSRRDGRRGLVAEAVFGAGAGLGSPAGDLTGGAAGLSARHAGGRGALVAALPGRPVTELLEVTLDGESVPEGWLEADLPAGLLWRADGRPWPVAPDPPVLVTYSHGMAPPVGGVAAAVLLTLELGKAHVGDGSCSLPQRVQTLTRQGVTVGFRDTFESLDSNRTGLWSVDAFVQSVNPAKLTAPPGVWSPDAVRGRRTVL